MFKMYLAQAIDSSKDHGRNMTNEISELISMYPKIELLGAGIGESPILDINDSPKTLKMAIVAYDLRKLRECDILLMITDGTYCPGTAMELEYARNLGLYTIVLILDPDIGNIFLDQASKIIYSTLELRDILEELSNE